MHNYKIKKRNGALVNYDAKKIRAVIEWAANDFNLSVIKLESILAMSLRDGITTREIQKTVILGALSLISLEEPDWKYVAGRLQLFDMYKEAAILRKQTISLYAPSAFVTYLTKSIAQGIYVNNLATKYSVTEMKYLAEFIQPKYDLVYDYAGINLLKKRYLIEHDNQLWELPQEMYLIIAMVIAQDLEQSTRSEHIREIYEELAKRQISLATPILMNLRKPSGNLSSCFITMMDDSRESIFYTIDQIAAISQCGGGVGCNMSRIRGKGARIRNIKNASGGVVPWIRIINDTAVAVNQQGKRKGAVTVSLDIWHIDIEDFLELQTENGDQRMKAYDIFPQVVIPDLFMEKVIANENWLLVDPAEVRTKYKVEIGDLWGKEFATLYQTLVTDAKLELSRFVAAKSLFIKIMKAQIETGMPYLAFKDTLNRYNPNKHDGSILATNLCTESHSNIRPATVQAKYLTGKTTNQKATGGLVHVCNLASINLANIDHYQELEAICRIAVNFLDTAIDYTTCPVPEGYVHNIHYRTIGVGMMGLADHLAKKNIAYTKSANYVNKLFEAFALYNIKASIELAKIKGTFAAYVGSDWDRGIILGHDQQWFQHNTNFPDKWSQVFHELKQYGIRNSQLSAIAPNTSSALLQGCSASILPVYSRFFVDTHNKGSIPNCPPFIKEKFWYYQENKNIEQKLVIDIVAAINHWVDTGISLELIYNLNNKVTAKTIYECIMHAWKKGIKTIYYTRSIQQDGSVTHHDECTACTS